MAKDDSTGERVYEINDLSGGMQQATTPFQKQINQLGYAENAEYGEIGGVGKSLGYVQRASDLTSTTSTSTSTSTTTTSTSTSSSTSTSTSTSTTA
jgi:hypothetical protein